MISRVFDDRFSGVSRSQLNYSDIMDDVIQLVHAVIGEFDFCIVHDLYPTIEGTNNPAPLEVPIQVISPFFSTTAPLPPQTGIMVQHNILFIGIRLHDHTTVYFPYQQLLELQSQGRIITDLDDASSRRSGVMGFLQGSRQEVLLDKMLHEIDGSSVTSHVLGLPFTAQAKVGVNSYVDLSRDAKGNVAATDLVGLALLPQESIDHFTFGSIIVGDHYRVSLAEVEDTLLQWAKTHQRDFDDHVCNGRVTITPETVHIDIANRVDQTALHVINETFRNVSYPGSPGTP